MAWLPSRPTISLRPFASTPRAARRSMSAVTAVTLSEGPSSKSSTCFLPVVSIPIATTTQTSRVSQTPSMKTASQSA
jgi:hypothetical protein